MADRSFGVKEINIVGSAGTPTISSPDNINLDGIKVAISTDLQVGRNISVVGVISAPTFIGGGSGITGVSTAGYASTSGVSALAQGLTGSPNINVGFLTANLVQVTGGYIKSPDGLDSILLYSGSGIVSFRYPINISGSINNGFGDQVIGFAGTNIIVNQIFGDGSPLSGIVTSLVQGTNVSITNTGGIYTISASGGGVGDSYWQSNGGVGIGTTAKVGIGTTNPTEFLTVKGNVSITGNIDLTGEISSPTRIKFGSGGENIKIGDLTGGFGAANVAIGDQALGLNNSGLGHNIAIGQLSYYAVTSGQYNIGVGDRAGQNITSGSYNVILGAYNGQTGLDIRSLSNNVVIADGQGNIRQYINSSGNVGIKTTVITEALTVAGVVSATSFYGTLNAGQLTGSLPAIDGSALIGVVGSGSGVVIEDDATPVGTAGTINFGSNLSVSFASGTVTVSGSGVATYANVSGIATYATTAGISTTSSYATSSGISTYASTSGISTYATSSGISSSLISTASVNTSGIITATSFFGSGSGLTNLPSGQLTGALPALDGSALINVTASGTGIVVEDDNVNVGSAVTVNFGTGLDVTFSSGIATVSSSGGSLQSRVTVSGVTTSIPNLGIGNTDITGFKSYALMKVGLSTAGWIRLYTDSISRDNDVTRSVGEDPMPGSGVIAEVVTTGISTTQIISPFTIGGDINDPPDGVIYVAIQNLSGSTQTITANLTILQLEA